MPQTPEERKQRKREAAKVSSMRRRERMKEQLGAIRRESFWEDYPHAPALLMELNDLHLAVVELTYGIGPDREVLSFAEIGRRLGISRQRVWQMHKKAMNHLRGY